MACRLVLLVACVILAGCTAPGWSQPAGGLLSVADYESIQAAIDANPGRMIFVPPGDHVISRKLRIAGEGTGLWGYGRVVQTDPAATILEIEHARGVRISGLTLTRAEGREDATAPGLFCWDSHDVDIDGVQVINSRSRDAAIELRECTGCTVRNCRVLNYKRVAVDDRTGPGAALYGYAFRCIDGTGIMVRESRGTQIVNNRVEEQNLLPTREMKELHGLGALTEGRHPTAPGKFGAEAVKGGYVSNWHQGSAIVVTSPEATSHTTVTGNHLVNSGQGIDLHCDRAVVSDNVIDYSLIGIKAMHGSLNLIISRNIITNVDLWGILLNPGTSSHAAQAAQGDQPARAANVDAGTIIANNIISDYGYGHDYWNLGRNPDDLGSSFAIAFLRPQLPTSPPLTDVIVLGNMVYDAGRDEVLVDGKPQVAPPRYRYAVCIEPWRVDDKTGPVYPTNIHFLGNVFHPGAEGISNIELKP